MIFKMEHNCICVADLARTADFYSQALDLNVLRRKEAEDRDILFLGGEHSPHQIEVVCMHGRTAPYDLGENPTHLAFRTDDIALAKARHQAMGCFHHELPAFGVYFIADPDGYLTEVMPTR